MHHLILAPCSNKNPVRSYSVYMYIIGKPFRFRGILRYLTLTFLYYSSSPYFIHTLNLDILSQNKGGMQLGLPLIYSLAFVYHVYHTSVTYRLDSYKVKLADNNTAGPYKTRKGIRREVFFFNLVRTFNLLYMSQFRGETNICK